MTRGTLGLRLQPQRVRRPPVGARLTPISNWSYGAVFHSEPQSSTPAGSTPAEVLAELARTWPAMAAPPPLVLGVFKAVVADKLERASNRAVKLSMELLANSAPYYVPAGLPCCDIGEQFTTTGGGAGKAAGVADGAPATAGMSAATTRPAASISAAMTGECRNECIRFF